jgi:hypothetical protein
VTSIVPAYWYVSSNLGDNLTPWLISRMGKTACWAPDHSATPKYIVSGSILSHANGAATVWGAGLGSSDQIVNPAANLIAVRGPLSKFRAEECGASCGNVFGDPGLLVPKFYQPGSTCLDRVGIVPHFIDQDRVFQVYASQDVALISLLESVEHVVDAYKTCSMIVSSALHGLILAVAMQIPFVWVRFSDAVQGYPFKFLDFFLSLGDTAPRVMDLRGSELPTPSEFRELAISPPAYNIEPFWELCPFR